jgi:hypothetical protein
MSHEINLKEMERSAWKRFHQDGVWDFFLGLLVLWIALFDVVEKFGMPKAANYAILLGVYAVPLVGMQVFKKRVTIPRLGRVKFGKGRKMRKLYMVALLLVSVLVNVGLILLIRYWRESGTTPVWWAGSDLTPNLIVSTWVFITFSGMAFWMDFPRMIFLGGTIAFSMLAAMYFNNPFPFFIAAVVMFISGAIVLARFLRDYPLPQENLNNDQQNA